nr:hypothetical protein Iba_chr10fCG6990 [Ipomoea batatas]
MKKTKAPSSIAVDEEDKDTEFQAVRMGVKGSNKVKNKKVREMRPRKTILLRGKRRANKAKAQEEGANNLVPKEEVEETRTRYR